MPILEVKNLNVSFKTIDGIVKAVNDVSFTVEQGEVLGIVGESGSGKSQTVLGIMGLLASNSIVSGSIKFLGQELIGVSTAALNKVRGNKLSIIFQDPMTSLNPYLTIKSQMTEVLTLHKGMSKRDALAESIRLLDFVRIPEAKERVGLYPHEFSGGMRQRVMIAMALLCRPELLIADEPTTALDVTVQAQILQILRDLQTEFKMSVVIITHDMGVVANICDRVNVMYAGRLLESGSIDNIFFDAKHPYTQALLNSIPSLDHQVEKLITIPGEPPNLMSLPQGCVFQGRCEKVHNDCCNGDIMVQEFADKRFMKCNLALGQG
ncbi:MAG: ATP-binding cassette domain-containing protein [Proteobacteria bacterium]|jgi:oligopeptide transport system ATP-binding protein|nr:ATP-binding cassette domain-containing protein [Pseudomonadota bacterium]